MMKIMENTLENKPETKTSKIIVTGDFNFPFMDWKNHGGNVYLNKLKGNIKKEDRSQANILLDMMDTYALIQEISEPTRGKNILDLLMTNNSEMIMRVNIIPIALTDHKLIRADLKLDPIKHKMNDTSQEGIFSGLNLYSNNINWDEINQEIQKVDWENILDNVMPDEMLDKIEQEIRKVICNRIPLKTTRKRNKHERQIRTLFKKRSKLVKSLKKCIQEERKIEIENKLLENDCALEVIFKQKEAEEETRAIENTLTNPKYIFAYAKRKRNTIAGIGPLKNKDDRYEKDPQNMSEILNTQFKSVFTTPKEQWKVHNIDLHFKVDDETRNSKDTLHDLTFTTEDIEKAISKLKDNAAAGPDSWSARFLKKCKTSISFPLYILWRKSLDTGKIPAKLKMANITPLFKGGDRSMAKNYRPVALTSHIIKIFERVIKEKLSDHLESNGKYNGDQHGFRSGRSCLSQLLDHQEAILEALSEKCNYDVIYTDFAKAFDKCDHGILAHKMVLAGVTGKVGKWIYHFLTKRKQRVVVSGKKSNETEVTSSVPQSTVLAPILFLIMISDINSNVEKSKVSSFADDTKISYKISKEENITELQRDIDKVFKWAKENNLCFNADKFQLLRYGQNQELQDTRYTTENGTEIEQKAYVKDIGVIMEADAEFSEHYKQTIATARKVIGLIWRSFKTRKAEVMLKMWKSLVLPIIDYCSVLVAPTKKGEIADIERLQRMFTAKIEEVKHLDYWNRLEALKLYSLQRRHERYIIIYTWKIMEGLVPNFTLNPINYFINDRKGIRCAIPHIKGQGRIKRLRETSLALRGPRLFNELPKEVNMLRGVSTETFKAALDKHLSKVADRPVLLGYFEEEGGTSNSLLERKQRSNSLPIGGRAMDLS